MENLARRRIGLKDPGQVRFQLEPQSDFNRVKLMMDVLRVREEKIKNHEQELKNKLNGREKELEKLIGQQKQLLVCTITFLIYIYIYI